MNKIIINKVKKEVQKAKDVYSANRKLIDLLFNEKIQDAGLANTEETDLENMVNLMTDILYHEHYLDSFKNALDGSDEAGEYYNVSFINRHLKIILHEYEMITNNLDSIIFENNDLCE